MKFGNQEKGVAGLTILLSIVTMLFVIGLLVMIFALMGGEIADTDAVKKAHTSASTSETGVDFDDDGLTLTACATHDFGVISTISLVNSTLATMTIPTTNYTTSGCVVSEVSASIYNNTEVNVTYTFTYEGASYDVMNDTVGGISNVTDWFDIFVVISAMVVLILLTVIIIGAIRGSGLMESGISSGNGNVGSA